MLPDNDAPGRRYAEAACSDLHGVAADLRVLDLPDLGEGDDVADHLARGGDRETLERYAAAAPHWKPAEGGRPTPEAPPARSRPVLGQAALHGVAGEIVRAIEPHSEADSAALLVTVLAFVGAAIGRTPHALAGGSRHTVNNNFVIVGDTGKGRKGSSLGPVKQLMKSVSPDFMDASVASGLSSGEGLIHAVRDAPEKADKAHDLVDHGVADKRLLVVEEEMVSVLKVASREGNTLSAILRQAWDGGDLRVLTRNNPIRATNAHIGILGHITGSELQRQLTETEAANGFANRFLWIHSRRSKLLPDGGATPDCGDAVSRLKSAIEWASGHEEPITRDGEARALWHAGYGPLSEGKPGLLGAILGRAEAHVLRLSVLYAVLDQSPVVQVPHLEAALAVWAYAEASARFIFGERLGDPVADSILEAVRGAGSAGIDRTAISALFGRHQPASRIGVAIEQLLAANLIQARREQTAGAPRTLYVPVGTSIP